MKTNLFKIFIVGMILLFCTATAKAQSVTLQEKKDAWVCSCAPAANNYGIYAKLYQGVYFQNGHKCFARIFLQWDLTNIPQGSTISNAKMELKCSAVHGTPTGKMVFYMVTQDWDQKIVTDQNAPQCSLADSIIVDWPSRGQWLLIDVTKFVQYWFEHPDLNLGIVGHCFGTTGSGAGAVEFNNYQYVSSPDRPKLTVSYSTPTDVDNSHEQPLEFNLKTYPNPFNPSVNILYTLEKRSQVVVKIFDVSGKQVDQLFSNYQEAGKYNYVWNASRFGSGIYFVCLTSDKNQIVKKIILLK